MRINWFSPLAPARTDVAHFTARILPALRTQAEVTLWTDQPEWDQSLHRFAPVRRFDPDRMPPWAELNQADVTFYNIGNNPSFHGSIWQVSRRHPGLVVLHDLRLHHFFDGFYRREWNRADEYLAEMRRLYGEAGRRHAAESLQHNAADMDEMAERYPLTSFALAGALGAIVHTREAFANLKQENRWPVAHAPLPFPSGPQIFQDQKWSSEARSNSYRLIIFGYINPNRRLHVVLEALAGLLPEQQRFHLHVYGELWDERSVRQSIEELDLANVVTLHGFVPEEQLDEALAHAHLAINLRYPSMGEASGSQLRIWSHALPTLVTKVGWYADLPSDAVVHVRPAGEYEVSDIRQALRDFLHNPAVFARMGAVGRRILEERHGPQAYVEVLLRMALEAAQFRSISAAYSLTERVAAELSVWTARTESKEVYRGVAEEISVLTNH